MTKLSAVDKYSASAEDSSLARLLDLDGEIMEMGEGYWVEIDVSRVPCSEAKPHGIDYSMCLLDPNGNRLVCYDNAHPLRVGRPPSRKTTKTNDHRHTRGKAAPYAYTSAEALMEDFWRDVEKVLKEEGVPK